MLTVIGSANFISYSWIAELITPIMAAALGSLVIELSKMGMMSSPAWADAALPRMRAVRVATTRPHDPRRTHGIHPFSRRRRLIGDPSAGIFQMIPQRRRGGARLPSAGFHQRP